MFFLGLLPTQGSSCRPKPFPESPRPGKRMAQEGDAPGSQVQRKGCLSAGSTFVGIRGSWIDPGWVWEPNKFQHSSEPCGTGFRCSGGLEVLGQGWTQKPEIGGEGREEEKVCQALLLGASASSSSSSSSGDPPTRRPGAARGLYWLFLGLECGMGAGI